MKTTFSRTLFFLILLSIVTNHSGQSVHTSRHITDNYIQLNIQQEVVNGSYEMINRQEKGWIFLQKIEDGVSLMVLDTQLIIKNTIQVFLNSPYELNTYIQHDEMLYILFTPDKRFSMSNSINGFKKFELVEIHLVTGKARKILGKMDYMLENCQMHWINNNICLMGFNTISEAQKNVRCLINFACCYVPGFFNILNYPGRAVAINCNFDRSEYYILYPNFGKSPYLRLISGNVNPQKDEVNLLIKNIRSKSETKLYLQTLSHNSFSMSEGKRTELRVSDGLLYEAFNARVNDLTTNDRLVFGTFGNKTYKMGQKSDFFSPASGIYISRIGKLDVVWSKNYFFTQLMVRGKKNENFNKRQNSGISISNYQMTFHDAIETDSSIIIIGEMFYPQYHTECSYDFQGRTTSCKQVFDGFNYQYGLIVCIDKQGNLRWSELTDLPRYRTTVPGKKLLKVGLSEEKFIVSMFYGYNIYNYYFNENGLIETSSSFFDEEENSSQKNKITYVNMDYWYGDYYMIFGSAKEKTNRWNADGKNFIFIRKMRTGKKFNWDE